MAQKKRTEYNDQSITMLKGADRVRKRPAVIFGSDGLEGCEHSVFEIISNSVDEAREGHGDVITTTVFKDRSIQIEDDGRGVPLGYNEKEKRYNWELVYNELYAGGKYNNNSSGSYEYSLGLNGLGACATQYSSEFFEVTSYNGTTVSQMSFKKGNPVGDLVVRESTKKDKKHGTVQRWKPDIEVFTDINIPREYFTEMLKKQSVVNSGVKFIFNWQNDDNSFDTVEYLCPNGIIDYVTELAGESSMTSPVLWKMEAVGRDREDKDDYKLKAEFSFCISNTTKAIEFYHNASFLEHGGSPDRALKTAFVYAIDKYLKSSGKYNKNEAKITFADVEECLIYVSNSFSTVTSYANQTKKAITNTFIAEAMTNFLKHQLEIYFAERPADAEKMCAQILVNKRSREHAEHTRLDIKKKLSSTIDISNRVDKFANCRSRDPEKRELFIVEGNSALTSCKLARDPEFQAIMPVRGKTLNCESSTYEKIFKNEIIINLLKVIGCGVEIKGKVKGDILPFNYDNFKWNKIIICTDADKDGYHIRTLILSMLNRLLPTLIKMGRVYIVESPLFEINTKNETFYAYTEREKLDIIAKIGDAKYTIQRSKGLGENSPEMMSLTTMSPATRRLIQITDVDEQIKANAFDLFLGDNAEARRAFIAENGAKYLDDLDLSDGD